MKKNAIHAPKAVYSFPEITQIEIFPNSTILEDTINSAGGSAETGAGAGGTDGGWEDE